MYETRMKSGLTEELNVQRPIAIVGIKITLCALHTIDLLSAAYFVASILMETALSVLKVSVYSFVIACSMKR